MKIEKKNTTIFFIGTRWMVLEKILDFPLKVAAILTPEGSYLEKELKSRKIAHKLLSSKDDTIDKINRADFDILVSNGCPYILPISQLKKNGQLFINIHPSLLPDLRGGSPVNGAILYNKPAGATCHIMDDNVDTGPIISRVNVKRTENIDLGLLYQLCFLAEADAFTIAYKRGFKPLAKRNINKANNIYYTRKQNDLFIDFHDEIDNLIRKVKAFGVPSQGSIFYYNNKMFKVLDAKPITNKFLLSKLNNYDDGEIIFKYDNTIVVKLGCHLLEFCGIIGNMDYIEVGKNIFNSTGANVNT